MSTALKHLITASLSPSVVETIRHRLYTNLNDMLHGDQPIDPHLDDPPPEPVQPYHHPHLNTDSSDQ